MKILASLLTGVLLALSLAPLRAGETVNLPNPITESDYFDNGNPSSEKVELGRLLFFDKILSGNKNISCATCHHPSLASADAVALSFGEGPGGLGTDRRTEPGIEHSVHERVPRNSPALFNLGAMEFTTLFHDGRVETDPNGFYEGGFITPAKWKLPAGLESVLAAQAMFPVTSPTEMAGQKGENEIADARSLNNAAGKNGVWALIATRLRAIPEYVELFQSAFPSKVQTADDVTMVLAANAIAAFETVAFRADKSMFDTFLRDGTGLTRAAELGMELFYGKAACQNCHSGAFQTDHDFHAIAMPQIGPGKSDGSDPTYWRESGLRDFLEDFGRGRVTARSEDNFKFRTPSLRNVELTGPWGHTGAFSSLEDVVRHHLDPIASLEEYDISKAELPKMNHVLELQADGPQIVQRQLKGDRLDSFAQRDSWVQKNDNARGKIATANELERIELTDSEIGYLVSFLESLTDPSSRNLDGLVPVSVPSGLDIDR